MRHDNFLADMLRPTLFKRMLGVQLGIVLVLLGLYTAIGLWGIYARGEGALDRDLKLFAEATARMAALVPTSAGAQRAANDVTEMVQEDTKPVLGGSHVSWQVWTADGQLLARSQEQPRVRDLPPGSLSAQGRTVTDGWWLAGAYSADRSTFAVFGWSENYAARVRGALVADVFISTSVLLGVLSIALWLATAYGLRPLNRFAESLGTRGGDETLPLEVARHRELVPIVTRLNLLLAHIRSQREAERSFFADAAHELRTPLAAINAQAHALASDTDQLGSASHLALERGVARAANVVDKVLTLARLDSDAFALRCISFDACAAAREAVARQAMRVLQRNGALSLAAPATLQLQGDAGLLAIALDNILDNALRYTPGTAAIEMTVVRDGAWIRIDVEDAGPGLPDDESTRVFTRFERGQHSEGIDGSGLGLAIVARAMQRCGGRAEAAQSARLGGACFSLWLPAVEPTRVTA